MIIVIEIDFYAVNDEKSGHSQYFMPTKISKVIQLGNIFVDFQLNKTKNNLPLP